MNQHQNNKGNYYSKNNKYNRSHQNNKKGYQNSNIKDNKEEIKKALEENNITEIITIARQTAEAIKEVKTNQVRRLYASVVKIQNQMISGDNQWERELSMLKPRVIYASAREKNLQQLKSDVINFVEFIEESKKDDKENGAKNFFAYMEAVVAYHK